MSAPEPAAPPTVDALRDAVDVMDRLYSPGGCPWDREQTHVSLVQYLLEEAHELAEAIETGDRAGMREELGDLLLQVLFHARIASEEQEPFTVDDVAADLVAKLVRRHPHVFAEGAPGRGAGTATDLHAQWDAIKKAEKRRSSVLEGISHTQGALARAQKVLSRSERGGLGDAARGAVPVSSDEAVPADLLGRELFDVVVRAQAAGVDAEAALRAELRRVEAGIVAAERAGTQDGARAEGAAANA